MASRIIHYCIANEILKQLELDRPSFVLGNIIPDAHNQTRQGNYATHFRYADYELKDDLIDINAFKERYIFHSKDHLILGYYCHLICDNIWLRKGHIYTREEKAKVSTLYENDYTILNNLLVNEYFLEPIDLRNVKIDSIDGINDEGMSRVLDFFDKELLGRSNDNKLMILSLSEVKAYISECVRACVDAIKTDSCITMKG